jgi:hypothetical protein
MANSEVYMPTYLGPHPSLRLSPIAKDSDATLRVDQTPHAWVTPVCSLSVPHRRTTLASSPVYWYTDTRIRSLEPRSSLSGQDVILPTYQVH